MSDFKTNATSQSLESKKTSYTKIIKSASGLQIPEKENIAFHSKYDPIKEAQTFSAQFDNEKSFYIIGGLCGAYHVWAILKKNAGNKAIIIENSEKDIRFLSEIESVQRLLKNTNAIITTPENLYEKIINNFLPALYGNARILFLRSWENQFSKTAQKTKIIIKRAINDVLNDFSTQRCFGKIWQRNIFQNLSFAKYSDTNAFLKIAAKKANTNRVKTAAVVAAGPSLDKSISTLKKEREKYFVISVDTAFPVLLKNEIDSDIVISIDGQMISHSHFIDEIPKKTLFAFDLCACNSSVRKIKQKNAHFIFFESGHPLAVFASNFRDKTFFTHLCTGSGTVTCAAFSLARVLGFEKIEFFGADFSYSNGKSYAKGTYFDELYFSCANRIVSAETLFSGLFFRSKLRKIAENIYDTPLLATYKKSLEDLKTFKTRTSFRLSSPAQFSSTELKSRLIAMLKNQRIDFHDDPRNLFILIPQASFFQKQASREESFNLALTKTLLYTDWL